MSGPEQERFIERFSLIPRQLSIAMHGRPDLLPYNFMTVVTSMFLHGSVLHLGGNMLYLWIFGNNIEDVFGHGKFLIFYLAGGVVAAAAQLSADPGSSIPMIGASGAVSGVLGAYLLLFPRARVKTLIFIVIFITTVEIPAMLLLTIWFFMQVGLAQVQSPGVAWFAHIGGFVFGAIAVGVFGAGRGGRRRGGAGGARPR